MKPNRLTNEKLLKEFNSPFDLVNYAINHAKDLVVSGRQPRVNVHVQNPAYQALEEIIQGKDKMAGAPAAPAEEQPEVAEVVAEPAAAEEDVEEVVASDEEPTDGDAAPDSEECATV